MKIVGKYKLVYGEKMCGVYKITNPVGRIYVGSSKDIKGRYHCHKSSSIKDAAFYNNLKCYDVQNNIRGISRTTKVGVFEYYNCR